MSDGLLREDSVPSGSKLKAEWQTLSPDQLSKKMFEIVDDVNAVFQVSCGVGVASINHASFSCRHLT